MDLQVFLVVFSLSFLSHNNEKITPKKEKKKEHFIATGRVWLFMTNDLWK